MSTMAPHVRKHLSADALFALVRSGFATIPEPRRDQGDISLTDALMSAFAMFSLKAPSLLAFDKERAEGNLHTIYGIARVPCDTHMREILDPIFPKMLRPVFKSLFRQLQRGRALEALTFLDGHYLLALDGTEYFSSKTIHCASCLHRVHRNGSITHSRRAGLLDRSMAPIGRHDRGGVFDGHTGANFLDILSDKTDKSFASIPSRKTLKQTLLFHPKRFEPIF
jgi:hypothetical protein